jgi:prepilin-type N-terminal cleavage/methylation domain-containing protein
MTAIGNGINQLRIASRGLRIERQSATMSSASIANRKSQIVNFRAFTLIELLVVISIIALLAALIFPVAGSVKRLSAIQNAQAEMAQLETAIDRYKAAYGFYPPDSANTVSNIPINQLYFELLGTTNTAGNSPNPKYQSLDDPTIQLTGGTGGQLSIIFGVNGFMNCNKPGSSEDASVAQNFLPGLKPDQIAIFTNNDVPNYPIKLIVTSVGGPARTYPWGVPNLNPWRYVSQGTNNPGSYDLWVELVFGQQTNLVCNWNKRVQINSPWP